MRYKDKVHNLLIEKQKNQDESPIQNVQNELHKTYQILSYLLLSFINYNEEN